VSDKAKRRPFLVGKEEDGVYLSLYEFLKDLLPDCCRSVNKTKIEWCVPGIADGQFDGSKLAVQPF